MNVKAILAALLMLCGACFVSTSRSADFRCLVYSGASGTTLEKSSNKDGAYLVKANDATAAEAGALQKAATYKKGITLTSAKCTAVAAAPGNASSGAATAAPTEPSVPAPAPAPTATATPAPSAGATRFYCMVYEEGTNEQLKAPAGMGEEDIVWWVPTSGPSTAEGDAVALARSKGLNADSAQCASSLARLSSY